MSSNQEPSNLSDCSSSESISLQRIIGPTPVRTSGQNNLQAFHSSSNLVQVNARNINDFVQIEVQNSNGVDSNDNGNPTAVNSAPPDEKDGRGTTSMNPRSKRARPQKPKANAGTATASAVILEAKRQAQALAQEEKAKRVTRSSNGNRNSNSNIGGNSTENNFPEPEIVVMKDHLQPVSILRKN